MGPPLTLVADVLSRPAAPLAPPQASLADSCDEFLVHGVDVEGMQLGIDDELVEALGCWSPIPVTYAGGARTLVKGCAGRAHGGGRRRARGAGALRGVALGPSAPLAARAARGGAAGKLIACRGRAAQAHRPNHGCVMSPSVCCSL
jgi:hypothetical protein